MSADLAKALCESFSLQGSTNSVELGGLRLEEDKKWTV
jgi:hypothetical protein